MNARMFQIQLLGYNSDLYGNVSQALASSNGLAIIALLGRVGRFVVASRWGDLVWVIGHLSKQCQYLEDVSSTLSTVQYQT